MNACPEDVRAALTEVLRIALLRIRRAAGAGDAKLCFIEADHVHNLPQLLGHFSHDLLTFYLKVERESYRDQLQRHTAADARYRDIGEMDGPWQILERYAHLRPVHV
jgi:hypothetical protein